MHQGVGSIPQESTSHADTSMLGGYTGGLTNTKMGATIHNDSLENLTLGQMIGDNTQMTHERVKVHECNNLQPEESSEEEDSPEPISTAMIKSEILAKDGVTLKNQANRLAFRQNLSK